MVSEGAARQRAGVWPLVAARPPEADGTCRPRSRHQRHVWFGACRLESGLASRPPNPAVRKVPELRTAPPLAGDRFVILGPLSLPAPAARTSPPPRKPCHPGIPPHNPLPLRITRHRLDIPEPLRRPLL